MIKLEKLSNFTVVSKYQLIIEVRGIRMFEIIAMVLSLSAFTFFAIVKSLGGAFMGNG
ncbi:MAG: hypothetical protein ACP5NO_02075 [Thermoplasmata archaeon]